MNMQLKYKYHYNFENFFFILYLIILFIPKIDLISFEGYWQGIRFEDLALLAYAATLIFNYEEKIVNNKIVQNFSGLILYFGIIFFSSFIGKLSDGLIVYVSLVRVIEYFALIVLLCNINFSKEKIILFLKIYVLANIFFVILQKLHLIGSFTSLGYLAPSHFLSARIMGLSGGSWELGVIISLCYFILVKLENPSYSKLILYFLIAFYLNLEAQNRVNFFGFIISNLIFLKYYISRKEYFFTLSLMLFGGIVAFLTIEYFNIISFNRLVETNYIQAIEILKQFIIFIELPSRESLDTSVWSLWYRLFLWKKLIAPYFDNFFTIVFGGGLYTIYFESTWLRVIFSTGLLGLVYVIYMIRNLELYIVTFFIVVGLTLDIFNSFKIFAFTILYFRFFYENNSYRRN